MVVCVGYTELSVSSDVLFSFPPSFLPALCSCFSTAITSLNCVAKNEHVDFTIFREVFCLQQYLCLDAVCCLF